MTTTSPATRPTRRPRHGSRPRLEPMEPRALLATFTVTSPADAGPGTLREAIERANTDPDPDTIDFAPVALGTIRLETMLPVLTTDLAITGPGAEMLTVAGGEGFTDRILAVDPGATVALSGLTITGGNAAEGGGIRNRGTLDLADSRVEGNGFDFGRTGPPNSQVGVRGGGIFNEGTLTIRRSLVMGNDAAHFVPLGRFSFREGAGGGIFNMGRLTIADSTIQGNKAGRDGGGGIFNAGAVEITGSAIELNEVSPGYITPSRGGGIFNDSDAIAIIRTSTLSENDGAGRGGGISNKGRVELIASTVARNSARGPSGLGDGGGVENSGEMRIASSTISGNQIVALFGNGGGIVNEGSLILISSTLSGNEVPPPLPFGSGGEGGAIFNASGSLTIMSTLFDAPDGGGGTVASRPSASVTSGGHNLFSDDPGLDLDPTDLIDTDPRLGPLADNGGPTPTHALLPGSPALDAAVPADGLTADQRGIPCPQGTAPDIGAFEVEQSSRLVVTPGSSTNSLGQTVTITATITDARGMPLAGVPAAIQVVAGPNRGAAGPIESTDAQGRLRFSYRGDGGPGTDTVIAAAVLDGGVPAASMPVTVAWEVPPPTVIALHRLGVHAQPTRLVVSFDAAMDPTRSEDPANYRLLAPGRDRRLGTADDRALAIDAATYDEALRAVTLATGRRLPLHLSYRLTVVGTPPGGVTSASGVPLDGSGTGQPGSDYEATFGREALVRPESEARAARVAELRRLHQGRRAELVQQHRERQAERLALREGRLAALREARAGLVGG